MKLILILVCLCWCSAAFAADTPLPDDAAERRAHALFSQLRCTVCEGQPLSASNAELAVEMRNLIRRQVTDGRSDAEILSYFTARYGDAILMHPPVAAHTALLWAAPLIFLGLGGGIFLLHRKKRAC